MSTSYTLSYYVDGGTCCRCGRQGTESDKLIVRQTLNWRGTRVVGESISCPNSMQCESVQAARVLHALTGD